MKQGLRKWAFCSPFVLAISLLAIAQGASSDNHASASAVATSLNDLAAAQQEASSIVLPTTQQIRNTLVHIDTPQSGGLTQTDPGQGLTSTALDREINLAEGRAILISAAAAGRKFHIEHPGVVGQLSNDVPQAAAQSLGIKQLSGVDQDISNMRTGESNLQSASRASDRATADAETIDTESTDQLNNEASAGDSADSIIEEGEQVLSNDPLPEGGAEGGAADDAATDAGEAAEMGAD